MNCHLHYLRKRIFLTPVSSRDMRFLLHNVRMNAPWNELLPGKRISLTPVSSRDMRFLIHNGVNAPWNENISFHHLPLWKEDSGY
jgi:hypothetical protein